MIAKSLINEYIPPLRTSDTGKEALQHMEIFKVSHLPIVNNLILLGIISENDIYNLNDPEQPLGNHKLELNNAYVYEYQHIYEVGQIFFEKDLTLIPVVKENKEYLGCITLKDLLKGFVKITNIEKVGSIIVLEMNIRDYSLAEIARIVEDENAKILSCYISELPDSTKILVTLKVNLEDLTRLISSFNRFNYVVRNTFLDNSYIRQMYKERLDYLFKYLEI